MILYNQEKGTANESWRETFQRRVFERCVSQGLERKLLVETILYQKGGRSPMANEELQLHMLSTSDRLSVVQR